MHESIKLIVIRGRTADFESLPPRSIALDGYVQGPAIDLEGQRFSFDHHANCLRLVTRATCQQVMDAILLGLEPAGFNVYVNDVDGDTVLSVWLLQNPDKVRIPEVREMVEAVGMIDAHGPAWPDPGVGYDFYSNVMAYVTGLHKTGVYHQCNLELAMSESLQALSEFVDADFPKGRPMGECEVETWRMSDDGSWGIFSSDSPGAFRHLYDRGYNRAIVYNRLPDGSYRYTIGKKSDLVAGFPVGPADKPGTILHHLNFLEPGWGGGSTIGGSPRNEDGSSSQLGPHTIFRIVKDFLQ